MKRLFATLVCDIRLQFRNGFYYAAAFVAVVMALLLNQVRFVDLALLLPIFVLGDILVNTFYFVGGLVLLEKGEGTLAAQVVTPLRTSEYLAAKVVTLSLLALIESLIIVAAAYGPGFVVLPLVAGVVVLAVLYTLYGFVVVARYDSINSYLLPSVVYTAVLSLPLVDYLGLWRSWLFYLHPIQAPLLLLRAAFQPLAPWQLVYGVLYGALWIGLMYLAGRRAFDRFVIEREGST
jgi:fluoroquinolone transport system permease protein